MIKIQNSVPSVYYDSSRDFQLIGHLFDLVLNSVKTEADLLFNLPLSVNSDDQLLDLLAFTLGLRLSKEKYTSGQLRAVCSIAPRMMRNKGSLQAVDLLCTALMRADSIDGEFYSEITEDGSQLVVYITDISTCQDILHEILPYIVPAGMIFNVKEMTSFRQNFVSKTGFKETVKFGISQRSPQIFDSSILEVEDLDKISAPLDTTFEDAGTDKNQPGTEFDDYEIKTNFVGGIANITVANITELNSATEVTEESIMLFEED